MATTERQASVSALAPRAEFRGHFVLAIVGFPCVVDQLHGAVATIGNASPFLSDHVHSTVVVLTYAMATHEWIDDQCVDVQILDLRDDIIDHWTKDRASPARRIRQ